MTLVPIIALRLQRHAGVHRGFVVGSFEQESNASFIIIVLPPLASLSTLEYCSSGSGGLSRMQMDDTRNVPGLYPHRKILWVS